MIIKNYGIECTYTTHINIIKLCQTSFKKDDLFPRQQSTNYTALALIVNHLIKILLYYIHYYTITCLRNLS